MIKRIITAGVLALAITPNFINEEVYAQAQYNMGLEIATMEVPINWVEPGDEVSLEISITNNPGFNMLSFLVKRDENTHEYLSAHSNRHIIPFSGVITGYFRGDHSIANIFTSNLEYGPYYDADGQFCFVTITLPETINIGDFYSVEFLTECINNDDEIGFYKDGIFYGKENITSYINGGVRIVEERPIYQDPVGDPVTEPPVVTDPPITEPVVTDPPQTELPVTDPPQTAPLVTDPPQNTDSPQTEPSQVETTVTETETGQITTSGTLVTSETVETTTSEITSTAKETTKVSQTATESTTSVTKTIKETTEPVIKAEDKSEQETVKEKKSMLIPAMIIAGILAVGGVIFAVIKKRKNTK